MPDRYVPDQFEMARRALVAAAPQDGSVNVATVGASPFLYGRAKPLSALEEQIQRERRRQDFERQRYDQAFAELTTLPQWMADRMGPQAATRARREAFETASRLPTPSGAPLADRYAAIDYDFRMAPRRAQQAREAASADRLQEARDFVSPELTTRRRTEHDERIAQLTDSRFPDVPPAERLRYGLLERLLSAWAAPSAVGGRPDPADVQSLVDMFLPGAGGASPTPTGDAGMSVSAAEVAAEAQELGVSPEELRRLYEAEGITIR